MARHFSTARPKKARLGQNFLVSPSAPAAILGAMGDLRGSCVLEIGPGHGVLTRSLAERSLHLTAVELDPVLAAGLRAEFATRPEVEILEENILRVELDSLRSPAGERWRVVGNLPYYITSEILLHLFRHHAAIETAVLMMQREVADRVTASPGGRDYGLLSATTQMYAKAESLFTLPPDAFSPPPQVYSTVVRLTMHPRFAELEVPEEPFLRFLRQLFAQKRKTLANNLRAAGYEPAAIQKALPQEMQTVRAETVSLETMAQLFRALESQPAILTARLPGDSSETDGEQTAQ
ncbi:MAG TPA: 16S rRNA (adenine(1518)-N(6)/adenine(1519)-N(6))-dimethyltransferase RsmA [Acidobacteriaceae bacterium]|jgi:16S rRNA (adenine1518-N6/adenine1519-N6)-dimethyltransferase|nr:16S rRNA (adenine(1518)-N(6)/adenine(1519)-N(6))-dimethyltransferase RsmA [Acidobacteriaceae bacterium]